MDRVFLLSDSEANEYFSDDNRICLPTKYAILHGAMTDLVRVKKDDHSELEERCMWWTRTTANKHIIGESDDVEAVCFVDYQGATGDFICYEADQKGLAIRPAMWLSIPEHVD